MMVMVDGSYNGRGGVTRCPEYEHSLYIQMGLEDQKSAVTSATIKV